MWAAGGHCYGRRSRSVHSLADSAGRRWLLWRQEIGQSSPQRSVPTAAALPILLRCIRTRLALLGPREMSDLSPHSGPTRTLNRLLSPIAIVAVSNRDLMSTRPNTAARGVEKFFRVTVVK